MKENKENREALKAQYTRVLRSIFDRVDNNKTDEEKDKRVERIMQNIADKEIVTADEKRFRKILMSVGRKNTRNFLHHLKVNDFFRVPATINHHGNWKGGLVNHSLKVYDYAMKIREEMLAKDPSLADQLNDNSIAVAALLHDYCTTDDYDIDADGTISLKTSFKSNLGGHGFLSVVLIMYHHYELTGEEILAIRWHMGLKDIKDPQEKKDYEKAYKGSALLRLIVEANQKASEEK